MEIYRFPPLTINRLVREAVFGYYLRKIEFPDLDKPFVELDPATMPWPASAMPIVIFARCVSEERVSVGKPV